MILTLACPDRPGIVRDLSTSLAERGVSIEDLHTEVVDGPGAAERVGVAVTCLEHRLVEFHRLHQD